MCHVSMDSLPKYLNDLFGMIFPTSLVTTTFLENFVKYHLNFYISNYCIFSLLFCAADHKRCVVRLCAYIQIFMCYSLYTTVFSSLFLNPPVGCCQLSCRLQISAHLTSRYRHYNFLCMHPIIIINKSYNLFLLSKCYYNISVKYSRFLKLIL